MTATPVTFGSIVHGASLRRTEKRIDCLLSLQQTCVYFLFLFHVWFQEARRSTRGCAAVGMIYDCMRDRDLEGLVVGEDW